MTQINPIHPFVPIIWGSILNIPLMAAANKLGGRNENTRMALIAASCFIGIPIFSVYADLHCRCQPGYDCLPAKELEILDNLNFMVGAYVCATIAAVGYQALKYMCRK